MALERQGKQFQMLAQIEYQDPAYPAPFVVPRDLATFRTDLASIPRWFAWLIPGMGTHLPAVLLHDGLVRGPDEPPTHVGPDVDREESDRILRDAMRSLGTPVIRRWVMWTACALATAWSAMTPRWRWRAVVVATVGIVTVLGAIATLDLLDVWDVLPWMGQRVWWQELAGGAFFAVVISFALSLLWGRRWPAGAIAGVGIAFMLHVTALIAVLYGIYWCLETAVSRREGTKASVTKSYFTAPVGPVSVAPQ